MFSIGRIQSQDSILGIWFSESFGNVLGHCVQIQIKFERVGFKIFYFLKIWKQKKIPHSEMN